jgi:sensor domain CHASE-containing protein
MKYTRNVWVVVGCVTALVLGTMSSIILSCLEEQRRYEAREVANAFSSRFLERLNETLGALYLISASVDRQTGTISRFEELSTDLMSDFPLLRALELAPGGVISRVYPLRGNEAVIGHDLLTDKTRNREVHLAISRRQLAVAGPFELRQGGVGIVARYPLYQVSGDGRSRFWGLSIAVIDVPSLLRVAGESEFEQLGYKYQICWIPPGEGACRLAIGDPALSPEDAVVSKFGTGHAEWRLMIQPRQGWANSFERWVAALMAGLGASLAGWLAYRFVRRRCCSGHLASPAT